MSVAPETRPRPVHTLRLLLGDQLNAAHSWWQAPQDDVMTVMMECRQETDYARHHVQKVLAFFLAMRSFGKERIAEGHHVHYLAIDGPDAARPMFGVARVGLRSATEFVYRPPTSGGSTRCSAKRDTWPETAGCR